MGYKLTGDMGYTSNWADALEKCVIDGTETAIGELGRERSFYGDGALRAVRDLAHESGESGQVTHFNKWHVNVSSEIIEIVKKQTPPSGDACITSPRN